MVFLRKKAGPSRQITILPDMVGWLLLSAMFYNAVLAFVNSHIFSVSIAIVMASEMMIVGTVFAIVMLNLPNYKSIRLPATYLLFSAIIFLYVSIAQEHIYLKSIRDILIIVGFFMLGTLTDEKAIVRTIMIAAALVFAFIVVDGFFTTAYVYLFEPASYYLNTRGIEVLEVDEIGIFKNALGYETRFSFNIVDHRVSSLFLEQVSLANFSMILMIFLSAFWTKLSKASRLFIFSTIILAVLTNDTRTGMALAIIVFIGHFLFPFLPRFSTLIYMPLLLILSFLLFYDPNSVRMQDNLPGRIGHSLRILANMEWEWFVSGSIEQIVTSADSGFGYIIFTQTILGLLAFWLFCTLSLSYDGSETKRFAHNLNCYVFINLLVGAAIFSIKTSAPLWIIAGYLYYRSSHNNFSHGNRNQRLQN